MKEQFRMQLDLFITPARPMDMSDAERRKVVELLRALLMEAAAKPANQHSHDIKKEASNEQDCR